jgi:hypothetical protein
LEVGVEKGSNYVTYKEALFDRFSISSLVLVDKIISQVSYYTLKYK